MNIVMIGPFGLQPKATLSVRALPMAKALVARGHSVTLLVPPWDHPADAGREWEEWHGDVGDSSYVAWLDLRLRANEDFHRLAR